MKLFRIIIAAPFILIGALFYKVGELISGEKYVRHEDLVERNTIFKHKMYQYSMNKPRGNNRTPGKKKRRK